MFSWGENTRNFCAIGLGYIASYLYIKEYLAHFLSILSKKDQNGRNDGKTIIIIIIEEEEIFLQLLII